MMEASGRRRDGRRKDIGNFCMTLLGYYSRWKAHRFREDATVLDGDLMRVYYPVSTVPAFESVSRDSKCNLPTEGMQEIQNPDKSFHTFMPKGSLHAWAQLLRRITLFEPIAQRRCC